MSQAQPGWPLVIGPCPAPRDAARAAMVCRPARVETARAARSKPAMARLRWGSRRNASLSAVSGCRRATRHGGVHGGGVRLVVDEVSGVASGHGHVEDHEVVLLNGLVDFKAQAGERGAEQLAVA